MAAIIPTTQFTQHFINNRINDPISNIVIDRTYGGIVHQPHTKRRIRVADISILQNDKQFESDILANLIAVTYPVLYLNDTLGGAFPEGFISSDGFGQAAIDIIKGLGQRQGYHSLSFQRVGLLSLPQLATRLLPTDPGGVWLKHGGVPSDVSPPAITSSPALFRMTASWNGIIPTTNQLNFDVMIRRDNTFPWAVATGASLGGSKSTAFTVNLASSTYGNSPEIAIRVQSGVVTDITIDIMITGK